MNEKERIQMMLRKCAKSVERITEITSTHTLKPLA